MESAAGLQPPKRLRADRDLAKAADTKRFLRESGILLEPTNAREQWQNGAAEKGIQDTNRMARSMLIDARAPRAMDLHACVMAV